MPSRDLMLEKHAVNPGPAGGRVLNPRKAVLAVALLTIMTSAACYARPQDSRDSAVVAADPAGAASPDPAAAPAAQHGKPPTAGNFGTDRHFAIGFQASTLGLGGQVAYRLTNRLNVRGGFNFLKVTDSITSNQITYTGALNFRSAQANLDWFFLGPLHLSGGALLYNGNGITATVAVPTGQTFTLNNTTYESGSPSLGGTANLTLNKVAPSILFGVGNMIPRNGRRFAGQFEIGAIYEGSPNFVFGLTGTVCQPPNSSGLTCVAVSDPSVQANVTAQEAKINHDAAPFRFYPIISGGFSIAF